MTKQLRIIGLLIVSIAMANPLYAQSCIDLFNKAKSLQANGKYEEAINYYERAKACDPYLTKGCDKGIKECIERSKEYLNISDTEIIIPYQGSDSRIKIMSNLKWQAESQYDWCKTEMTDKNELIIQCREANNSTREKINYVKVKSGSLYQTIRVVQAARPEYIDVSATSLSFPANGTEQSLQIESNAKWSVSAVPTWCAIETQDTLIRISVSPNNIARDRSGEIIIYSPSGNKVVVKLFQGAGNENLTLSQSELNVASEGDIRYVKVYTDADNWYVGDFPNWINVQKVGKDSLRIQCARNIPNGEIRSGSVQVNTDRQKAGIMVTQGAIMPQDLIFPESSIVGGNNVSVGLSAGLYVPFVSASSGGEYVGSVVDYGLGTRAENADYKSAFGYNFGLFGDIRLYKNIFLQVGINFTQIKYKNEFNRTTSVTIPMSYKYMKGDVHNAYTESYSHTMIEIPILASYRFKTGHVSHIQLNAGPVLNIGLKSNMALSGNSDSETMKMYYTMTGERVDNANYVSHTAVNADFNLYQPCVLWSESYTTGNDAEILHHDKFSASPLKKVNCGLRLGVAYEFAGLSFGIAYTAMVSNMTNRNYWENPRFTILNESKVTMSGYSQRIHTLEFKLAYTLRYLKNRK